MSREAGHGGAQCAWCGGVPRRPCCTVLILRCFLVPSWCFVHAHVLWLLAGNSLGKEGAVALAPHLGKLVKLTSLDLYGE